MQVKFRLRFGTAMISCAVLGGACDSRFLAGNVNSDGGRVDGDMAADATGSVGMDAPVGTDAGGAVILEPPYISVEVNGTRWYGAIPPPADHVPVGMWSFGMLGSGWGWGSSLGVVTILLGISQDVGGLVPGAYRCYPGSSEPLAPGTKWAVVELYDDPVYQFYSTREPASSCVVTILSAAGAKIVQGTFSGILPRKSKAGLGPESVTLTDGIFEAVAKERLPPGAACYSSKECGQMTNRQPPPLYGCRPPGSKMGCGIRMNDMCGSDSDCRGDAGGGTRICERGPCNGKICMDGCTGNAGCENWEVCNPSHRCVARPCATNTDCPSNFRCDKDSLCTRETCTYNFDCPPRGVCLYTGLADGSGPSYCYDTTGTCGQIVFF